MNCSAWDHAIGKWGFLCAVEKRHRFAGSFLPWLGTLVFCWQQREGAGRLFGQFRRNPGGRSIRQSRMGRNPPPVPTTS